MEISKNAVKVSDLSEPQSYIKTNVEMYKTDYILKRMKFKYKATSIVQAKGIKNLKKSRLKKKGADRK